MKLIQQTHYLLSGKCPICGEEGIEQMMEKLPREGVYMKFTHNKDKTEHSWAEYDTPMTAETNKRIVKPKIIICPVCHKRGRINDFHEDSKKVHIVTYVVTHEALKGTWGKKGIVRKRRRCYIKDPAHREIILKKLGRFISSD